MNVVKKGGLAYGLDEKRIQLLIATATGGRTVDVDVVMAWWSGWERSHGNIQKANIEARFRSPLFDDLTLFIFHREHHDGAPPPIDWSRI